MLPSVGEFIQWENSGFLMFNPLRRVEKLSSCRRFAFVEGSGTGIPVNEIVEIHKEREPKPVGHCHEWKRLCYRLHELMNLGQGASEEAERVRENMDLHWFCLSDKERDEISEFNLMLYERFRS
jgi:hypothetical protein